MIRKFDLSGSSVQAEALLRTELKSRINRTFGKHTRATIANLQGDIVESDVKPYDVLTVGSKLGIYDISDPNNPILETLIATFPI